MARLALLADIHANREALDATLERVAALSPDRILLLGDIVGYGPDPAYAVETAQRLMDAGAICLLGNHDEAALRGPSGMNEDARDAMRWTQRRLTDAHRAFLASLPMTHMEGDLLFVHASAAEPAAWRYIVNTDAARQCLDHTPAHSVFCGHSHVPAIFYAAKGRPVTRFTPPDNKPAPLFSGRRQVVVVGAVGQPRDGNPAACAALLDTDSMSVTMLRTPYDAERTQRKIAAAGLPPWLGARLLIGR